MTTAHLDHVALLRRRPRRRYPIRVGLIGLVLLCLVPAAIAVAILVRQNERLAEAAVYGETMLRARGLVAVVERELTKVGTSLEVLGASGRVESGDVSELAERLRGLPRTIVRHLVLLDRQGRPQAVTTIAGGGARNATSRAWPSLKPLTEVGRPVLTDAFADPVDGQPVFAIGLAVARSGGAVSTLYAVISPLRLSGILEQQGLPPGWVAAFVDGRGTIVGRSRDAARFVGKRAVADLVDRASGANEGVLQTTTMEGDEVLTAFSHSSMSGAWLAVGAPRELLLGEWRRSIAIVAIGALAMFAIAIGLAFRLARSVSRSVSGLIEPAVALGDGRPVHLPDTSLQEADEVGQALLQASQRLLDARHQAHHDPLTGLCNRILFDELVLHQMAAARRAGQTLAVLAIDLDGFKRVNDAHGHAAGDVVLKAAASRIAGIVRRASDVVSRRGGDEFSVLLHAATVAEAEQVAGKLLELLSAPYEGVPSPVSASIGVAFHASSGESLADLLERADRALYQAKHAGKARFVTSRDER